MTVLIISIVTILIIALGPAINLWGGTGNYLAVFVLLSAFAGRWRLFVLWLLAWSVEALFRVFLVAELFALCAFSLVGFFVFRAWIDRDNKLMSFLVSWLIICLYIASLIARSMLTAWPAYLGSIILCLPIIIYWYVFNQRESGVKL